MSHCDGEAGQTACWESRHSSSSVASDAEGEEAAGATRPNASVCGAVTEAMAQWPKAQSGLVQSGLLLSQRPEQMGVEAWVLA